jgi:DNA processing protein
MIKKEYLITLLELYTYRTARVWEEIKKNDFSFANDSDFLVYLRTLVKDKRNEVLFDFKAIQKAINKTNKAIDYCQNNTLPISIITFEDDLYPREKMNLIPELERPIVLYGMGNTALLDMESVALIGSRETDFAYMEKGVEIGKILAKNYVIVSGLAIGSDTAAHKGALLTNGNTIAILANGLQTVYPKVNSELANDIYKKGGLLLSEYPPFSATQPYFFAQRDRLQAALSKAVIVIETGEKSGTMITTNYAKTYKKKIIVLEPFNDGKIYNDKGNELLLQNSEISMISLNSINLNHLVSMIETKKKPQLTFEIINTPNFKTYRYEGKDYTKIPKKYKEICRDNKHVIVESIE